MSQQKDQGMSSRCPEKHEMNPSRRNFIKFGSLAAAGLTVAGVAGAGYQAGGSAEAYTGIGRTLMGKDQFFDRTAFQVDTPKEFIPVGEVTRPHYTDSLFERFSVVGAALASGAWNPGMGAEGLPAGPAGDQYRRNPESYALMLRQLEAAQKQHEAFYSGKNLRYAIASAYTEAFLGGMFPHGDYAMGYHAIPEDPSVMPDGHPDKWDYRYIWRKEPLEFRSPRLASELIKKMAHSFGASLVGICKFDERFMFTDYMRGIPDAAPVPGMGDRGRGTWGTGVPKHWKSVIIFGAPMHWDGILAATGYSTSYDAYLRVSNIASTLERFIQELGHPARSQFPPFGYEIMLPPYALLAGLGEYSRSGLVVTPELGSNFRPSAVITDIDFEYDKPIEFGVADFCRKCKICAETCPSGALSLADEPEKTVRGFRCWKLDSEKCFLQWASAPIRDPNGCRVCIGVCPYTRKNTWIHSISREVDARDPTGIVSSALLAMQKNFFSYPRAQDFKADWDGGREATYHNPPKWLRAEEYFRMEKTWEYYGMD